MTTEEVIEILKQTANEKRINVDWDQPNLLSLSFKELGVDSLDLFDVISTIEEKLQIHLSDETLANLKVLSDLVIAVQELKKDKN